MNGLEIFLIFFYTVSFCFVAEQKKAFNIKKITQVFISLFA